MKCILTAYDSNVSNNGNVLPILENKKKYSKKFCWDFICKTDGFYCDKPAAFSKIDFILEALRIYDTVFWNDMDCLFTDFNKDVTQDLGDNYLGSFCQGANFGYKKYFNTGNLLIKSNSYTIDFFKKLYTLDSWNQNAHPWEQTAFNELLLETKHEHLKVFKINEFGTFCKEGYWCFRPWQEGDFMLHLGLATWKLKFEVFEKIYKTFIENLS